MWSCALTGRAGLTYLEALESERRARVSLQNFPVCLLTPLLLLVKHNPSKRLSELSEDVYSFTKERYFPGETVDVSVRNGNRYGSEWVLVGLDPVLTCLLCSQTCVPGEAGAPSLLQR